jgi:uncharacterized protein (TIGR03435 family)
MKLAALLLAATAFAQTFEVASIRARQLPLHAIAGFHSSGARVEYEAWPVRLLVQEAYGLKPYEVTFTMPPPGADTDYYDVVAKAEGEKPRTRAEFRPMLQALLAERFHLQFHREGKEIPVYALVVGKGGPKLKASAGETDVPVHFGVNGRNQFIEAKKMTADELAGAIRDCFGPDRPVVDRTRLTGTYDLKLEATPAYRSREPEPTDLSLFTAIQEQLGLKLEPQKATIQVLVVDHIEKPSEN